MVAQSPTCAVSAVPPIVHSEGLAERLGDIVLQCSAQPGITVTASLSALLPISITNRIDAGGFSTDASLTIDTGSGPMPAGVSGLVTNQSISFSGFRFTAPANGLVTIRLTDLRADVNQLGLVQQAPIQASLSSTLALTQNPVTVAWARQGLFATISSSGVRCVGSPVPATVNVTNLFAEKTALETTRVTEGFPQAFQPKDPTSDAGTRIMINYTGFPAGASIYVPDAIAGSSATQPTAGGDLGIPAAVGEYQPGSSTLLLVRVLNADSTGNGGTLAALPAPNSQGLLVLNSANPVSVSSGAGYAVYEVVDANPAAQESAQIPSFFGILPNTPATVANLSVSLAPVSTVTAASTSAPIPRFAAVQPPSDCTVLGDCNASYFPQLQVTAPAFNITAVSGGKRVSAGFIQVANTRGGVLDWQASISYTNGAGWLILGATSGLNNYTIEVVADPSSLAPGTYQATVLIDAGPLAGSKSIPVTLTVNTASVQPFVAAVTNAANFQPGPVVAGELATVWGANLAGNTVTVTFDGSAASLLYTGAGQINLRVPPALSGKASTQMIVKVDGASSAPVAVQLAALAPALFSNGVLNQDSTLNSPSNPAAGGSVLQIFGTGLPDSGADVVVKIQNRDNLIPLYVGAAPGFPGVQQINVAVPADLGAMTASLTVCAVGAASQRYCSQPETIVLK